MTDTVQQIKDKLSIVEVVSPYVKLTRAGKNYRGLSPFNKEKTPSFYVSPDRGTYYCFSSWQGGDAFTFIEKMEGVDFKGALKILAEKAGVTIEYSGKGESKVLDRLREAMARAEQYYAQHLDEKGEAHTYALSRGLTAETIKAWNLGFAPDAWRGLLEELTTQGFSTEEMLAAGLIKEADGKRGTYYDRFRNRLMFPIKDGAGRTVAFTGRSLAKDEQAKYLNSPETALYRKSHVLFGIDKAKDAIRTRGFTLLVEGQFDLILLHQLGFQNTVALSGTALSSEHIALTKRYSDNLMLALDADRAGLAAAAKSAHIALREGLRVKAVRLPEGMDPADLAKDTPQDLVRRIKEAEPIIEFFLSVLSASERDQHRLVMHAERVVVPLIRAMRSPLEQDHFAQVTARALGLSLEAVRASMARGASEPTLPEEASRQEDPARTSRDELIRATIHAYPDTDLAKRLASEYARIIGSPLTDDTVSERALFEAGLLFGEAPLGTAGDDMLRTFERTVLTDRLAEAASALRMAENAKDQDRVATLLATCKTLSERLAAL